MAFNQEKRAARRLLAAIEDGKLNTTETFELINDADPTLVYLIFTWLRAWYPATHPASDGVLGRLTELLKQHPEAAQLAKEGESDSVVTWFEDEYNYQDLRAGDFIDLIVEKLEG